MRRLHIGRGDGVVLSPVDRAASSPSTVPPRLGRPRRLVLVDRELASFLHAAEVRRRRRWGSRSGGWPPASPLILTPPVPPWSAPSSIDVAADGSAFPADGGGGNGRHRG
ncbi:Os09g0432165 [Oryza sativa Japonica Group]|uniref:Os09g0432165 protein n=1 Tax=Oryza sativa subsp. japonica TaxID=39947 RepID=A0A0P0XNA6_ORYSJ|nr:Os09g0432165 [Oryza sativa Japonica Group]